MEQRSTSRRSESRGGGFRRSIAALACIFVAVGIALAAYSAHGADTSQALRLERASLYLMLHGAAAAALLIAQPASRWQLGAGALIVLGVSLFSGSLIAAALFGAPTVLAPLGGVMLILGWLCAGAAALLGRKS